MTDVAFTMVWASRSGTHAGMPTVEQCLADGYEPVGHDPRYPDSILMRKDETE